MRELRKAKVAVVGGGPAGLTAVKSLAGVADVLLLERESALGGIPRHSNHWGYGWRDLRTVTTGPAYARRLADQAAETGAELLTSAMVTGWDEHRLEVTTPGGLFTVEADAIVLATGARERPRAARRIPGDRPAGVYTTGELQNQVHLFGHRIGERAVVIGSELVSWSAVLTLRKAGVKTVLMTSARPAAETYAAVTLAGRVAFGVPVAVNATVERVIGKGRVEGVEVLDHATGKTTVIACDTVIFTADWIPDHELAAQRGLPLQPVSLAPLVDAALRTELPGVFAAGNLLHPVDTADNAALDGRQVAASVRKWLTDQTVPAGGVRLEVAGPLLWVAPGLIRPGQVEPVSGRLVAWVAEYRRLPRVVATQDGKVIGSVRTPWPAAPGRIFRIPSSILAKVNPSGSPVQLSLAG